MDENFWRKCSSCKKSIGYNQKYYVCSVSTCNGQRTGYVFCTVFCWEVHVPGANHRDAGAIEKMSPAKGTDSARRIIPTAVTHMAAPTKIPKDILIVASKLKDYIRARSEMNTSAEVMSVLSDIVRGKCDQAIDKARQAGRKTVLDRDFEH